MIKVAHELTRVVKYYGKPCDGYRPVAQYAFGLGGGEELELLISGLDINTLPSTSRPRYDMVPGHKAGRCRRDDIEGPIPKIQIVE